MTTDIVDIEVIEVIISLRVSQNQSMGTILKRRSCKQGLVVYAALRVTVKAIYNTVQRRGIGSCRRSFLIVVYPLERAPTMVGSLRSIDSYSRSVEFERRRCAILLTDGERAIIRIAVHR